MKLLEFTNCKTCIVRANCSSICNDFIDYVRKETTIKFDKNYPMSLESAKSLIKNVISVQRVQTWKNAFDRLTIQLEE